MTARYLALGLVAFICTLVPQRILMGGGVMHQEHVLPRVRHEVQQLLNDYIQVAALTAQLDDYIIPPALGDRAGVLGALVLAHTVQAQP
jgi:fructokinase